MGIQEKIEEIFALCASGQNTTDFAGVIKNFWPILDNSVSLCDLSGIFTVTNPKGTDTLDLHLFKEFLNGVSRMKYPYEVNHKEKLLADITVARSVTFNVDNATFQKAMDKSVMRVLLKFDMPLRRTFSTFAGRGVKVGGGLTWDEVKKMEIGMDLEGFLSFAGAHSITPEAMSIQQCTSLVRDISSRYPLVKSSTTLGTTMLYPQFQLLMCFAAVAIDNLTATAKAPKGRAFAKVMPTSDSKPLFRLLGDFFYRIGMNKVPLEPPVMRAAHSIEEDILFGSASADAFQNSGVVLSASAAPEDHYQGRSNHAREAMLMRMERLFEEVESRLRYIGTVVIPDDLSAKSTHEIVEDPFDKSKRHLSKPVVIGDAIPLPKEKTCPMTVKHYLEAALAHHNLASYDESLKYLEAARVALREAYRRKLEAKKIAERESAAAAEAQRKKQESDPESEATSPVPVLSNQPSTVEPVVVTDAEIEVPIELDLYVIFCKGNVYQSCGDDEHSLLQYLDGWRRASSKRLGEWEMIFLNSCALLAYYNLRYELAAVCFAAVAAYREKEYGTGSADTATAWNNRACCLYCSHEKGEARVLFENAVQVFIETLGQRHPRTVAAKSNFDKARRSQTIVSRLDLRDTAALRDGDELIVKGGTFSIQAANPYPEPEAKKKVIKKKGSKKK